MAYDYFQSINSRLRKLENVKEQKASTQPIIVRIMRGDKPSITDRLLTIPPKSQWRWNKKY